jgi:hypothetical protein
METPLILLYTHNLRGDLRRLPRLYTFLQALRREAPPDARHLLVDLGASCDPQVWPCDVTQGRAALFILDAMGYHAANIAGELAAEARAKLASQVMLALVDDEHPHRAGDLVFTTAANPTADNSPAALRIILTPADRTALTGDTLRLAGIDGGQAGAVHIDGGQLRARAVHTPPPHTLPEPTISGAVDFVLAEASQYQKRGGSNHS